MLPRCRAEPPAPKQDVAGLNFGRIRKLAVIPAVFAYAAHTAVAVPSIMDVDCRRENIGQ